MSSSFLVHPYLIKINCQNFPADRINLNIMNENRQFLVINF